ncbi:MAG: methyltransferase domain-containing protein [Thermoleophilia bacterium]|nr:methyltransferase domain-containing protein [Thermoleophilia bacterium]
MSPARAAALAALRRLRHENAALDESTAGLKELEGLEPRDRALAFELVTGVLRRRGSCDAVLERAATAPRRIEPDLLDVLRLGAYQLLFLDRVPAYAVVDDAVVMAGRSRRRRGFVNAVLRRVAAEGRDVLERLGAGEDDHALSVRFSVPEWIVALLRRDLGDEAATGVLEAAGQAPERCVRVNTTVIAPVAARAALEAAGYTVAAVDGLDDALVVDGPSLESSAPFREGLVTPQSRGSQLVAPVAVAGAEGAVLDLCAAPGTKTAHLAALRPKAHIVAVDVDPGRVEALRRNLRRLQVPLAAAGDPGVAVVGADALALPPEYAGAFDAVLVDAPCTGLGTMAARPDLRWRRRPADVARLATVQRRLLAAGAACVRPGGAVTYAVCTLTRQETTAVVEAFADGAEWSFDDLGAVHSRWAHPENGAYLRTLPPGDGSSGFFVARLRRRVSQAGAR